MKFLALRAALFAAVLALSASSILAFYKDEASTDPVRQGLESSQSGKTSSKDRWVPGEIIVKYKHLEDAGIAEGGASVKVAEIGTASASLKELNRKFKLQKMDRVMKVAAGGQKLSVFQKRRNQLDATALSTIGSLEQGFRRIFKLTFPEDADVEKIVKAYAADPNVEYVQPNYMHYMDWQPNDYYYNTDLQTPPVYSWGQLYADMFGLKKLECEKAWDSTNGNGAIVAVVDSGLDYNHPDIAANVWTNADEIPANGIDDDHNGYVDDVRGWDISDGDNNPLDTHGHGSHCAGTIAAIGNNTIGVIGVAPQTRIMAVKVFPISSSENCAAGMKYAADNGADVLSDSWGSDASTDPVVNEAVDYARAIGCVVVFAAGNSNDDVSKHSPASYAPTIAVAATDYLDTRAYFSNFGAGIDVSAPGVDILSLRANGTDMYGDGGLHVVGNVYYRANGTSMACPHAAGVAALIVSAHPEWTNTQVEDCLIATTDPIDYLNPNYAGKLGTGRVNAYRAATAVPAPSISVSGIKVLDSSGNNNGQLDPGETVTLNITLKNLWYAATNVAAVLSTSDPLLTVTQSNGTYGDLIRQQEATRGFTAVVSPDAPRGHEFILKLSITADGGYATERTVTITIPWPVRPGWPKALVPNAISPVDMNGDGICEVVIRAGSSIYIYNPDGSNFSSSWPKSIGSIQDPSFGDVDGDGNTEIVLTESIYNSTNLRVHMLRVDGTQPPGWPVTLPGSENLGQAVITDVRADIPGLEIIVPTYGTGKTTIHMLDYQGGLVSGFPVHVTSARYMFLTLGKATVTDLDNDGQPDILFSHYTSSDQGYIYAVNNIGQIKPGWPFTLTRGLLPKCIVTGDVDDDGKQEVVVGTSVLTGGTTDQLYVFNGQGQLYSPEWPKQDCLGESIALADLDGDLDLEIVASGWEDWDMRVFALHHNASPVQGWPVSLGARYPDVGAVGDLDADGDMEVVTSSVNNVCVWHHNAWPLAAAVPLVQAVTPYNNHHISHSICDLEGDGQLELLGGVGEQGKGYAYVWNFTSKYYHGGVEWPMQGFDVGRTGSYKRLASQKYKLVVLPLANTTFTGPVGGPFNPASKTYKLLNVGSEPFSWAASYTAEWLTVSPVDGTINPGESVIVTIALNAAAVNLPEASYSDTVTFKNTTTGEENVARSVTLSVKNANLQVTPADGLTAVHELGMPISPSSKVYTLANVGNAVLNWTASKTQSWLQLSSISGSLAPGQKVDVTVSFASSANYLTTGNYSDIVSFRNTTNGVGNTDRPVSLQVKEGCINVAPTDGFIFTCGADSFPPLASKTYTVTNIGYSPITWTAGKTQSWLTLSSTSGSLNPGTSMSVTATISASAKSMPIGTYTDTITFTNTLNGCGSTMRPVTLNVKGASMSVTPAVSWSSLGDPGGPFTPSSQTYTVKNDGYANLQWAASNAQPWVTLSSTGGMLSPGQSVSVTASLNTAAKSLPEGRYTDTLTFTNQVNGTGSASGIITLIIGKRIYVNKDSVQPVHDGKSWETGFLKIMDAVNAAVPGQEVVVTKGNYAECVTLKTGVNLYGGYLGSGKVRDITAYETTISSTSTSSDVLRTGSGSTIDGVTLTGGYFGIGCFAGPATITNCVIRNNSNCGMYVQSTGTVRVEDCRFISNLVGICDYRTSPIIRNNIFSGNNTGINLSNGGTPVVTGNTISSIRDGIISYAAGVISDNIITKCDRGLVISELNPTIANNTIVGNVTGIWSYPCSAQIHNNIVAFNTTGMYMWPTGTNVTLVKNDVFGNGKNYDPGSYPHTSDISVDPMFVDRGVQNYHITHESLCVNAGNNSVSGRQPIDIDGEPRIYGGIIDIGADELRPIRPSTWADHAFATLKGMIITVSFQDCFYMEADDRAWGIRVNGAYSVTPGMRADVAGSMQTMESGERYIQALSVTSSVSGTVTPIYVNIGALGGGDWQYNPITGSGQIGMTDGVGLNNVGLLVKTLGKVKSVGPDAFILTDGIAEVKVILPVGVNAPIEGSLVSVTGVVSCEKAGDYIKPVLKMREMRMLDLQ